MGVLERIEIPLLAGGINDEAADPHGIDRPDLLELENGYFVVPSAVAPRFGSVDGDVVQDDQGTPADVTSIPWVDYWASTDAIFMVSHSTVVSKHFVHSALPDGTGVSAAKAVPAAWQVASPSRIVGAPWFASKYYFCDTAQSLGMCKYDNSVVTLPVFDFHADPDGPLKPKSLFVHRNHLCVLGYGDENAPIAPALFRFSNIGDPDTFSSADNEMVGDTDEPLTVGVSLDEFALLFKERKVYRLTGNGRQSWRFTPIDQSRGAIGPRHAFVYQGMVWFVSEEGFAQIGASGPSRLLVDRVRLRWDGLDKPENIWIGVIPEDRQIVFGVHKLNDAGEYPGTLIGVDWRSLRWSERDYGVRARRGVAVPQGGSPAPAGPPVYVAETAVATTSWTANWTNGETRVGTTTRHESEDQDLGGGFVEDKSAVAGVTTIAITGKKSGTAYKERYRHERSGLYSVYSAVGDVFTDCGQAEIDAWGIDDATNRIQIDVKTDDPAPDQIQIDRRVSSPPGSWAQVIVDNSPVTGCNGPYFDTTAVEGTKYDYRARTERASHADGAFSAFDSAEFNAGIPEFSNGLCS